MTPDAARSVPSAERITDGAGAVPLAVSVFLVLDVLATLIGQAHGVSGSGPAGPLPALQMSLVVGASIATLYHRTRSAVVLGGAVVLLVFTAGPCGMEPWLLIITGVVAAARARWSHLGLLLLAQLGYGVGFGWRAERLYPGTGWSAGAITLAIVLSALGVGLLTRRLIQGRDARRSTVHQREREQAEIRAVERARLADELQSVVSQGLAAIQDELDKVAARPGGLPVLRSSLAQIDRHSRALLTELRDLLTILRTDSAPGLDAAPAAPPQGRRRWLDPLGARRVRIAIGAGTAAGAAGLSALLSGASDWDAVATTLLCFLTAFFYTPRRFWLVIVAVAAYAAVLTTTDATDPLDHILVVTVTGFFALATGLAARHFVLARADSQRRLDDLALAQDRSESDDRAAVARELHDVVAHQLSVTTMGVMATSMSDDCNQLVDTLASVRRSTESAQHELSTLLYAIRGPHADQLTLTPLVTPMVTAAALAERLTERGYRPVFDIDPAADDLDPTTQRTVTRIMQEGATNILRYSPAAASCHFTLEIDDSEVRLSITSPLAGTQRSSDCSLGWGLRGIRERVELTRGTFTAGPAHGDWVLQVSLPSQVTKTRPQPRSGPVRIG